MGTPSGDSGDGKDRCIEFHRDIQHFINKSAVEVHVRADAFVDMSSVRNHLRRQLFDHLVQPQFFLHSLLCGKLRHKCLEDPLPGIRDGVDGMPHPIDQAGPVKGFLHDELVQVAADLVLILPVGNVRADVRHHFHHLDVGSAMPRAFQGGHGSGDGRVGIRSGGSDNTGGEGGIVASAVLHMKHQACVQNPCLHLRAFAVGTEHEEDILCCRARILRPVDVHACQILIVVVGMVAIDCKHREDCDQVQTLADDIAKVSILCLCVIGCQCQDRPCHGIHDVAGGRLHDDISREVRRKISGDRQYIDELVCIQLVRQLPEQEKVSQRFIAKTMLRVLPDQVTDIVTAVPQLAVAGNTFSIDFLEGVDF